jgi:hypothetical protein
VPLNQYGTHTFILAMRGRFITIVGLTLSCFAAAASAADCPDTLQENKSQQNSADEAAVRGDLKAGSDCADAADKALSEKKIEDAAERASAKSTHRPVRLDKASERPLQTRPWQNTTRLRTVIPISEAPAPRHYS